ncbi:PTS sugar transporter subunit IIA [Lacticaseibacillus camelliae]|uniref:Phosphoenolpyruvate-dependent sugar phosphotransferase system EIIA, glucose specific n=1 Tax=Lacticaseibacillus camelliae DSM 22697 = JCM 13995 TaxID=1423730 RepID=A0A0R2FGR0_9LACO|nr:PTS glucose transporter subunit IIA [Lacticaseibacillus camelliae]KRN25221.1 phosphoenolpyruvate-dependent sugar phosphotransferase system EIIA, glucose specific [Lacticaseibacillus camelliae DSM 22697 = JCM 13995]
MFNFLKKKTNKVSFVAPATGQAMPITDVSDEMFSQKIMGDGYAVKPTSDDLYAPVSGSITSVFPTKHAISFKTPEGLEVLFHMGVDTVELKGAPFNLSVSEGQSVAAGDSLGTMDRSKISAAGKSDELIVVFTNTDLISSVSVVAKASIKHGDSLGEVTLVS